MIFNLILPLLCFVYNSHRLQTYPYLLLYSSVQPAELVLAIASQGPRDASVRAATWLTPGSLQSPVAQLQLLAPVSQVEYLSPFLW